MEKNDLYKIFAIAFVIVFVLEMIAIGVMNSNAKASGKNDGAAALPSFSGTATENMTLVRYEPYIYVQSDMNDSMIREAKENLISSGIATYDVPAKGGFVLNLRSGKDVPKAAEAFEKANASVLAVAVLSTPSRITVVSEGIATKVDGASFAMQLRPDYEEGSSIKASFVAYVEKGKLDSIGNVAFMPEYVKKARIPAIFESMRDASYIEVAWENRSAAKAIAKSENATFKEKSYIELPGATPEKIKAALEATKNYSTGAGKDFISVRNDFADRKKAEEDLAKIGLAFSFPPSVALFEEDDGIKAGRLMEKFKEAGIGASLVEKRLVKLKFPDEFASEGKKYKSAGYEVELEYNGTINETGKVVWLDAEFEAIGGKIRGFGSISVSADQTGGQEIAKSESS